MSDPRNITEWLQQLEIPWLVSGPNGRADVTSYGTVLDGQVALVKAAVKARFPELAPADALPYLASERGLLQGGTIGGGPSESNSAFGTRLKQAWDVPGWPVAGTPYAILIQLYYSLGYTNVIIAQQNGLIYGLVASPTGDPDTDLDIETAAPLITPATPGPDREDQKTIPAGTPWWYFDDKTDFCSRFVVIFPSPLPAWWTDIENPPTQTSAPSLSEVNAIRKIIQQWRNAEATCVGIIVSTSGLLWGYPQDQVWGAATGNWGGTTVVYSP